MSARSDRWGGVLRDVACTVAIVVCVDGALFLFADDTGSRGGPLIGALPGWAIGVVWLLLFVLLGIAHGRTRHVRSANGEAARRAVAVLIVACAVYPACTLGLRSATLGTVGNVAIIGLAALVVARTWALDRISAIAPCAVVAWVSFAMLTIVDEERWLW